MIDVKKAANSAITYFNDLYGKTYQDIIVEEIELTDDEQCWYITISYVERSLTAGFAHYLGGNREYKIFKINAKDGTVKSMKIREMNK